MKKLIFMLVVVLYNQYDGTGGLVLPNAGFTEAK